MHLPANAAPGTRRAISCASCGSTPSAAIGCTPASLSLAASSPPVAAIRAGTEPVKVSRASGRRHTAHTYNVIAGLCHHLGHDRIRHRRMDGIVFT